VIAWLGCAGGTPAEVAPAIPHFGEWPELWVAAAREDVGAIAVIARDLGSGEVEGPALAAVGGALGMLVVAEDIDEARGALDALAVACAGCHRERPLPAVAAAHRTALLHVANAVASGVPPGPGTDDVARAAVEAGAPGKAMTHCAGCHRR
jgi:hypothetical protein